MTSLSDTIGTLGRRARSLAGAAVLLAAAAAPAAAADLPTVKVAIGGAGCLCYLPTVLAEQLGEYEKAGVKVEMSNLKGGSQALTAVLGGSADVVSGYYDHCVNLAAKGKSLQAFVTYDRYPGLVLVVAPKNFATIKSVKDLAGKKVGVSAPGSSTDFFLKYLLHKDGIDPNQVPVIGVGLDATAVAPRPTPITAVPAGSRPFFFSMYFRKKSVEEPGAETPTALPARSFTDLMSRPASGEAASTIPGKRS